ncbi:MAG: GNAT family N-acetyltransferase [Kiloniellaceae bacterium]|nr:GNAT family N-acetyltransferase [Kiloniellaceae bacterium]
MTATIRPALLADQARIEAIVEAAYRPYLERMDRPPAPLLDDYARRIADGQTHVLEESGEILGLVVLEPCEDFLLLDNIAVDPACHGRGLGKRLMTFTETEARRQGYAAVELYTNELMVENIARYRHLGYVETKRVQVAGYDRVYLRKAL